MVDDTAFVVVAASSCSHQAPAAYASVSRASIGACAAGLGLPIVNLREYAQPRRRGYTVRRNSRGTNLRRLAAALPALPGIAGVAGRLPASAWAASGRCRQRRHLSGIRRQVPARAGQCGQVPAVVGIALQMPYENPALNPAFR